MKDDQSLSMPALLFCITCNSLKSAVEHNTPCRFSCQYCTVQLCRVIALFRPGTVLKTMRNCGRNSVSRKHLMPLFFVFGSSVYEKQNKVNSLKQSKCIHLCPPPSTLSLSAKKIATCQFHMQDVIQTQQLGRALLKDTYAPPKHLFSTGVELSNTVPDIQGKAFTMVRKSRFETSTQNVTTTALIPLPSVRSKKLNWSPRCNPRKLLLRTSYCLLNCCRVAPFIF